MDQINGKYYFSNINQQNSWWKLLCSIFFLVATDRRKYPGQFYITARDEIDSCEQVLFNESDKVIY